MDLHSAADRLALSREIIARWEAVGHPTGATEDQLPLLRDEQSVLSELKVAHPILAKEIVVLEQRLGLLALVLKLTA